MFATHNGRRPGSTRSSRLFNRCNDTDVESPVPNEENRASPRDEEGGEVLSILRNLQQQVSSIQAQQTAQATAPIAVSPAASISSNSTNSSPVEKKLPKDLTSLVRQTVKHLREKIEDPLEWNVSQRYNGGHNSSVTAEIIKNVANENFSAPLVRRAARTYFLTLQRRSKQVRSGKLNESQLKQRRSQRKHNKLRCRKAACLASTLTEAEKEKLLKILKLEFMSTEESGSESGSGEEMMTRRKIFLSRPLSWRSNQANNYFDSLDRKVERRRSARAKEMCRVRRVGPPSSRSPPDDDDIPM